MIDIKEDLNKAFGFDLCGVEFERNDLPELITAIINSVGKLSNITLTQLKYDAFSKEQYLDVLSMLFILTIRRDFIEHGKTRTYQNLYSYLKVVDNLENAGGGFLNGDYSKSIKKNMFLNRIVGLIAWSKCYSNRLLELAEGYGFTYKDIINGLARMIKEIKDDTSKEC